MGSSWVRGVRFPKPSSEGGALTAMSEGGRVMPPAHTVLQTDTRESVKPGGR